MLAVYCARRMDDGSRVKRAASPELQSLANCIAVSTIAGLLPRLNHF